ncbi:MAG: type II/IV secretion system protein [Alphaproteobacteria bacterium]|nr:type II/IV secretion system protein [Alphaproteobacteria bacterium]
MEAIIEALRQSAQISPEQAEAIRLAEGKGQETLVQLIHRLGRVDQQILAVELAQHFGCPQVTASDWPPTRVLPDRISLRFMREHHVMPLRADDDQLTVAVSDPSDAGMLNALRLASGRKLRLMIATDSQILSAIERLDSGQMDRTQAAGQTGGGDDDEHLADLALDAPVIDLVNRLFREASAARATDIHIEPARGRVVVRRRVDGMLRETERLPPDLGRAAVSRIKILTQLNIAERRLPQDGRARLRMGDRDYDIRVATMPTIHGESIAIRFLSATSQVPELTNLGLVPRDLAAIREQASHAHGLIAVTGPTGSGKTTTLAAVLSFLNDPTRKIVTIEDPVEYQVEGVNQIQVHPEIGLTFARTLRSLLRLDPDIIMVGEMRDSETATIGVNAALTGHLVLTTLHTNSAAGAITRLLDLDVQAFLIASTLRCAIAQRLVRKLCTSCRTSYEAAPELLAQLPPDLVKAAPKPVRLWQANGCDHCGGSGFLGRSAIFEVLVVNDALRHLIKPDVSADVIATAAKQAGMTTMVTDGFHKCLEGVTTIEELGRVAADD